MDYVYSGPYNVTVPAGRTRVVFNISITIDSENEGTESFDVVISSANLHSNVSIGNVSTTTVSIVDDIGKLRWFISICSECECLFSCDKFCSANVHHQ